jgi:formylglycine-generating enzyme required for sulfatase activity/serine/threonine protein kinase
LDHNLTVLHTYQKERIVRERYQILERLGHGGLGEVYQVLDLETHDQKILKIFSDYYLSKQVRFPDIFGAIRAEILYRDDRLVAIQDFGEDQAQRFIITDYIVGQDVLSYSGTAKLTASFVHKTFIPILEESREILEILHPLGYYGNIKPSNIRITGRGEIRWTDFFVLKFIDLAHYRVAQVHMGDTFAFMAPECIFQSKRIGPGADVYSLGVLAYYILTRTWPGRHLFVAPSALVPLFDANVDRVLQKALAREPLKRYPQVNEFIGALIDALESLELPDEATEVPMSRTEVTLLEPGMLDDDTILLEETEILESAAEEVTEKTAMADIVLEGERESSANSDSESGGLLFEVNEEETRAMAKLSDLGKLRKKGDDLIIDDEEEIPGGLVINESVSFNNQFHDQSVVMELSLESDDAGNTSTGLVIDSSQSMLSNDPRDHLFEIGNEDTKSVIMSAGQFQGIEYHQENAESELAYDDTQISSSPSLRLPIPIENGRSPGSDKLFEISYQSGGEFQGDTMVAPASGSHSTLASSPQEAKASDGKYPDSGGGNFSFMDQDTQTAHYLSKQSLPNKMILDIVSKNAFFHEPTLKRARRHKRLTSVWDLLLGLFLLGSALIGWAFFRHYPSSLPTRFLIQALWKGDFGLGKVSWQFVEEMRRGKGFSRAEYLAFLQNRVNNQLVRPMNDKNSDQLPGENPAGGKSGKIPGMRDLQPYLTNNSKLDGLITNAEEYYQKGNFLQPPGKNAVHACLQILRMDIANRYALDLLAEMTNKYIEWAKAAGAGSDREKSVTLYKKAQLVANGSEKTRQDYAYLQGEIDKLLEVSPANPATSCPSGMVSIPRGNFIIGSPEQDDMRGIYEKNNVTVSVDDYCIDQYEYPNELGEFPKVDVTWSEAQKFCTNQNKRLCSEQEWEKACKGSQMFRFPYGNTFDPQRCNTEDGNGYDRRVAPIGTFKQCQSDYKVFDMSGNIMEWTSSSYEEISTDIVVKGGDSSLPAWACRCANRENYLPDNRASKIGFRCCLDLKK